MRSELAILIGLMFWVGSTVETEAQYSYSSQVGVPQRVMLKSSAESEINFADRWGRVRIYSDDSNVHFVESATCRFEISTDQELKKTGVYADLFDFLGNTKTGEQVTMLGMLINGRKISVADEPLPVYCTGSENVIGAIAIVTGGLVAKFNTDEGRAKGTMLRPDNALGVNMIFAGVRPNGHSYPLGAVKSSVVEDFFTPKQERIAVDLVLQGILAALRRR